MSRFLGPPPLSTADYGPFPAYSAEPKKAKLQISVLRNPLTKHPSTKSRKSALKVDIDAAGKLTVSSTAPPRVFKFDERAKRDMEASNDVTYDASIAAVHWEGSVASESVGSALDAISGSKLSDSPLATGRLQYHPFWGESIHRSLYLIRENKSPTLALAKQKLPFPARTDDPDADSSAPSLFQNPFLRPLLLSAGPIRSLSGNEPGSRELCKLPGSRGFTEQRLMIGKRAYARAGDAVSGEVILTASEFDDVPPLWWRDMLPWDREEQQLFDRTHGTMCPCGCGFTVGQYPQLYEHPPDPPVTHPNDKQRSRVESRDETSAVKVGVASRRAEVRARARVAREQGLIGGSSAVGERLEQEWRWNIGLTRPVVDMRGWSFNSELTRELCERGAKLQDVRLGWWYTEGDVQPVDVLKAMVEQCRKLQHIQLMNCSQLDVTYIAHMNTTLYQKLHAGLLTMDVSHCVQVDDAFVQTVAKHNPELRRFRLYGCYQITDAALQAIGSGCKNLLALDVSWCHHLSEVGLGEVMLSCERLEELCCKGVGFSLQERVELMLESTAAVYSCEHATREQIVETQIRAALTTKYTDPAVLRMQIRKRIPLTHSVGGIHGTQWIQREVNQFAAIAVLGLTELDLTACRAVDDKVVGYLARACRSLQHLSLAQNSLLTNHSVEQLALFTTQLQSLDLNGCHNIQSPWSGAAAPTDALQAPDRFPFPRLRRLCLSGLEKLHPTDIASILEKATKLKSLNIGRTNSFGDEVIAGLVKQQQEQQRKLQEIQKQSSGSRMSLTGLAAAGYVQVFNV